LSYGRIMEELRLWIITETSAFRPLRIPAIDVRQNSGPSSVLLPIPIKSRATCGNRGLAKQKICNIA